MTTRSKINHINTQDDADSLQRRYDSLAIDRSNMRRAGSEATIITTASVFQSLKDYQRKAADENALIELCYKNIFDEFEPAMKKLTKAGRDLNKALNAVTSAQRAYNDAFKSLRDSCQKGQGTHMLDVVNAYIDINNINDATLEDMVEISNWQYNQIITACEDNLRDDPKKLRAMEREYHEGRIQVDKQIKKSIKRGSGNTAALQAQAFGIYAERKRQAEIEQRRRYIFVLERHAGLYSNLVNLGIKFQTLQPRVVDWLNLANKPKALNTGVTPVWGTMRSNIYEKNRINTESKRPAPPIPNGHQPQSLTDIKAKRHSMHELESLKNPNSSQPIMRDDSFFMKNRPPLTEQTFEKHSVENKKKGKESYESFDEDSDASTVELPPTSIDKRNSNIVYLSEQKTPVSNIPIPPPLPPAQTKIPQGGVSIFPMQQSTRQYVPRVPIKREDKSPITDGSLRSLYKPPTTSAPLPPAAKPKYRARHTYLASDSTQLGLTIGDMVTIVKNGNLGWSYGEKYEGGIKKTGWFPSSYIELAD